MTSGKFAALHLVGGLGGEGFKCRCIALGVGFDRGGDVLVAEVQNGEAESLLLAGDGAGDVSAAQRKAAAARGVDVVGDAADVEAEKIGLFGKRGEDTS